MTTPPQGLITTSLYKNPIIQLKSPSQQLVGTATAWVRRGATGEILTAVDGSQILITSTPTKPPADVVGVLIVEPDSLRSLPADGPADINGVSGRWTYPRPNAAEPTTEEEWLARRESVRESWKGKLSFTEEVRDAVGDVTQRGFRTPQIGALHAILAHWTVTTVPATIVMPTGTGKTETMLATLLTVRPTCLLVVVPTDALREQVGRKFASFGVLPQLGVLGDGELQHPIVALLKRRPTAPEEVRTLFSRCNVIVTTMAVAGTCLPDVQREMAHQASHLVIDEAHHISASTWTAFRRVFEGKPILQFTATPFRRDRKHVDGRPIYNYPLRKAQDEGLFQRVNFKPVVEFGGSLAADRAVAGTALSQLDADLTKGFDHLLMARAGTIARAKSLHAIYETLDQARIASGLDAFGVAVVHSELTSAERRDAMGRVTRRAARIIICVDMFGEGFDMPQLKVAALHDVHKSLAITLQFVGRFTRAVVSLGEATVVVNLGSAEVEESLRALYAEDADWNVVLRDLSTGASTRQLERSDFLRNFEPPPTDIPLQNVTPTMSTVVYNVDCKAWRPDLIARAIGEDRLRGTPSINHAERVALFVTREVDEVEWGDIREIADITWDLYVIHWDEKANLLYINSSNNRSLHEKLAKAVAGDEAVLIKGETIFRVYHDVRRLILLNLGLRHAIGRNIQFTMYVGADVLENLPGAAQANKIKSNMFGHGYEHGTRSGYGCSYKGRVWSNRNADDLVDWMEWARGVGAKLTNQAIDTSTALRFALIPKRATSRPPLAAFAADWPHEFYLRDEEVITFHFFDSDETLLNVGLEVVNNDEAGPLLLRVFSESSSVTYEVVFSHAGVSYKPVGGPDLMITIGKRRMSLADALKEGEPPIYFSDGSSLRGDALLVLPADYVAPFLRDRIEPGDWANIDITRESQGATKDPATVQRRVIDSLLAQTPQYDIVFDDDSSGESADIVAMRTDGSKLLVQLLHCKYSRKNFAGGRIDDLYEVCGQAQKSVHWKGTVDRLLRHLDRRELERLDGGGPSRFEKGDLAFLRDLRRRATSLDPSLEIVVVQPGLSATAASENQLGLLAVTELFLRETYAVPFRVIGSP